ALHEICGWPDLRLTLKWEGCMDERRVLLDHRGVLGSGVGDRRGRARGQCLGEALRVLGDEGEVHPLRREVAVHRGVDLLRRELPESLAVALEVVRRPVEEA